MHNSNTSEYILFKSSPRSCPLLVDIFNMSVCLIFSNWLSALHMNGRRKIWGELMNFLGCSMCPCFLRISLSGTGIDKTGYFSIWYLARGDWPEAARSQRACQASQLSGKTRLRGVLSGWCHLKGDLRGLAPGSQLCLSSAPYSSKDSKDGPVSHSTKADQFNKERKSILFHFLRLGARSWPQNSVRPDFTLKPQRIGTRRRQHNLDG